MLPWRSAACLKLDVSGSKRRLPAARRAWGRGLACLGHAFFFTALHGTEHHACDTMTDVAAQLATVSTQLQELTKVVAALAAGEAGKTAGASTEGARRPVLSVDTAPGSHARHPAGEAGGDALASPRTATFLKRGLSLETSSEEEAPTRPSIYPAS